MHRLLLLGIIAATSLTATAGAYAIDPQAEALRQEVVTSTQRAAVSGAEVTLITSHYEYVTIHYKYGSEPYAAGRPKRTGMIRVPHQVRPKTQFEVTPGRDGAAASFSPAPGQKGAPNIDPPTLAYAGDPFLSGFQKGFPSPTDPLVPTDPRIYMQNVHYKGVESKDGVDYKVLEVDRLIVNGPPVAGQETKVAVVVTDWKWYVAPDGLIHRLSWESHENVSGNEDVQMNEVIVNAFKKGETTTPALR